MKQHPTKMLAIQSGLIALSSASVQAGILHITAPSDAFIELNTDNTSYDWDVDSDNVTDFKLSTNTTGDLFTNTFVNLLWGAGVSPSNQNAFIVHNTNANFLLNVSVSKLISSTVDKVLAQTYINDQPMVGILSHTFKGAWATNNGVALINDGEFSTSVQISPYPIEKGHYQNIYAGFRLKEDGGDYFYGWAKFLVNTEHSEVRDNPGIQILEWAYNDTPGESIAVGAIPEPETVALGLGALALGAAGLRRWRKSKAVS